jgi:hypothetical protein
MALRVEARRIGVRKSDGAHNAAPAIRRILLAAFLVRIEFLEWTV